MKTKSRVRILIASILVIATIVGLCTTIASAASYDTNYSKYSTPSSSDYAYWNGSKVVRASGTTTSEIKWMQAALNWCIKNKGLNASYLEVDGSFGPASKKTCLAFQKKYGLDQDGSFGPNTIAKMKSVLTPTPTPTPTKKPNTSSKTLNINWSLIKATGKQSVSGPCFCYSLAYARDILDGKGEAHKWTAYRADGCQYAADCHKAGYKGNWASKNVALKAFYDGINSGKPSIACVTGGRSSGEHYVCIVGYTNVTNTSALSESNFLIIDSAGGGYNTENLGSLGYQLLKESKGYYYCYK